MAKHYTPYGSSYSLQLKSSEAGLGAQVTQSGFGKLQSNRRKSPRSTLHETMISALFGLLLVSLLIHQEIIAIGDPDGDVFAVRQFVDLPGVLTKYWLAMSGSWWRFRIPFVEDHKHSNFGIRGFIIFTPAHIHSKEMMVYLFRHHIGVHQLYRNVL